MIYEHYESDHYAKDCLAKLKHIKSAYFTYVSDKKDCLFEHKKTYLGTVSNTVGNFVTVIFDNETVMFHVIYFFDCFTFTTNEPLWEC